MLELLGAVLTSSTQLSLVFAPGKFNRVLLLFIRIDIGHAKSIFAALSRDEVIIGHFFRHDKLPLVHIIVGVCAIFNNAFILRLSWQSEFEYNRFLIDEETDEVDFG